MRTKSWCKRIALRSLVLVFAGIWGAAEAQDQAPNAQIGAKIAPASAGAASPNRGGNEEALGGVGWQSTPVFAGGFTVGVLRGDGRGDGATRLYATNITANTVREFTFDGSWTNTSNISLPFYAEGAILIGDGRLKGGTHLYVGEFFGGGSVREYTWDGASWAGESMGAAGQQLLAAEMSDARGDGSMHLYFSTGSSPPTNISHEFTFDGAAWRREPIQLPNLNSGTFGIAAGNARNDGVNRLYQGALAIAGGNYVYELSWNGASWDALQVANIGPQVMAIAIGDARNEGVNHLYVLVRDSGVREFTYDGTAWSQTDSIAVGSELFNVVIGDGQNDGLNRLYIAQLSPSRVMEVTFDGATWQTAVVGTPGGGVFRVHVGNARGDGVNRVYSSGGSGVVEFTHE